MGGLIIPNPKGQAALKKTRFFHATTFLECCLPIFINEKKNV